jgi:hypothetical protein
MNKSVTDNESVKVLYECIELQKKKSLDYQNPNSRIRQADHYPRGVNTIIDMVHQKMTRIYSLLETAELQNNSLNKPNFESIEDSMIDAINYLSFGVSYCRGKMDGQNPDRDMFNRKKVYTQLTSYNDSSTTGHLKNNIEPQNPASEIYICSGISPLQDPEGVTQ